MAQEMPRRHQNLFHTMTRAQFDGGRGRARRADPVPRSGTRSSSRWRASPRWSATATPTSPPRAIRRLRFARIRSASISSRTASTCARPTPTTPISSAPACSASAAPRPTRPTPRPGSSSGATTRWTSSFSLPCCSRCRRFSTRSASSPTWRKPPSPSRRRVGAASSCSRRPGPPTCFPPTRTRAGCGRTAGSTPAGDEDPLWLRDPKNKFWFEYLPESRALYVQFNQVGNKDDETIEAFSKRLSAFIDEQRRRSRHSRLAAQPGRQRQPQPPAHRRLSSASAKSRPAGRPLRPHRPEHVVRGADARERSRAVHGRRLRRGADGGKINHYGDSRRITLPHSGITVRVSTLWWQGDERDERPWKAPDVAAEPTFADYRANRRPGARSGARATRPRRLSRTRSSKRSRRRTRHARPRVFAAWKADPRHAWIDPEPQLNLAGYRLLAEKRCPRRSRSSGSPREASPQSANAFDSLGEAYAAAGDREAAIRSYEKALSLDPKLDSARDALAKLRAPGPS